MFEVDINQYKSMVWPGSDPLLVAEEVPCRGPVSRHAQEAAIEEKEVRWRHVPRKCHHETYETYI